MTAPVFRPVSGRFVRISKLAPKAIDDLYPGLRMEERVPVAYELRSENYLGIVVGLKWNGGTAWIYERDVSEAA